LKEVNSQDNFTQSIYNGSLGNKEDDAYPGTFGLGTVKEK